MKHRSAQAQLHQTGESESQMRITKEVTSIYGRCWCRERTIFWDPLGKIVICGAGGRSSRREEERMPRNGRWWR